jgi:hypothetical protein
MKGQDLISFHLEPLRPVIEAAPASIAGRFPAHLWSPQSGSAPLGIVEPRLDIPPNPMGVVSAAEKKPLMDPDESSECFAFRD